MLDTRDTLLIGRSTDGRTVRRPMSPHLQIYRWQITNTLSILHRLTGVALSVGTLFLVWWLAAAAASDGAYATVSAAIRFPLGILVLFGFTAALWYHFCNGIRHLAWDAGYAYDLRATHRGGWAMLAAAGVLSILTWIAILVAL